MDNDQPRLVYRPPAKRNMSEPGVGRKIRMEEVPLPPITEEERKAAAAAAVKSYFEETERALFEDEEETTGATEQSAMQQVVVEKAPAVFTVAAVYDGFAFTVAVSGDIERLKAIVKRLKDVGANPT